MIADFVLMCLYIVEGGFVSVFNGVVILLILTDRNLRQNNELLFITGLCFADGIDATGYFNGGIVRLMHLVQGTDHAGSTASSCFYTSYVTLMFYGYQLPPLMMLIVSIDRFFAVFAPVRHVSILTSSRLFVMLCAVVWVTVVYCCACVIISAGTERFVSRQCFAAEVYGAQLWAYVIGQRCCLIIVCVLMYIPIFVKTRQILKRKHGNPRMQRFNTTMTLVVFSALLLLAIPDSLCFFNAFGMSDYQIVFYMISINKCIVNVFVYTLRQRELRNKIVSVARRLYICRKQPYASSVAPVSTATADPGRRTECF